MPGINVTKTDDGFTVTLGNVNRQFPAPTDEFASMLVPELRRRIQIAVSDLRQFQEDFNRNFFEPNREWPSEAKAAEDEDEDEDYILGHWAGTERCTTKTFLELHSLWPQRRSVKLEQ